MFVRHGLGDALEDQIVQYQRALHDIAVAMDAARKSGQSAAADQLRVQFDALTKEVKRLVGAKFVQESPSPMALGFANFGEAFAKNAQKYALVVALGTVAIMIAPALLSRRRR